MALKPGWGGGLSSFKGAAENLKKPLRKTRFASALNVNSFHRLILLGSKNQEHKNCSLAGISTAAALCSELLNTFRKEGVPG